MRRPTLLIISQVYVPDPASVGQHLHDAAVEICRRGYDTRVLTSARGYDEPGVRFPPRERVDGVEVIRLPFSSFGKKSILVRLAGQICFLIQALLRGLFTPKLGAILVSTSPPMCSAVALIISTIRRVPLVYWVMDINPDQAIALGVVNAKSPLAWLFDVLNRMVLARAHRVLTLDRFMARRLMRKREIADRLEVFPPWPHEEHLDVIPHVANCFRRKHDLDGKFVVMYSGNHSAANPISTVIEAAEKMQDRAEIVFMFVGGGTCKKEVSDAITRGANNIVSLPYQPLEELKYSLSAADLHVVTLGNSSVGIVHPCKVYGALAVARPILLIGPKPSHVSDILQRCDVGRQVNHGDVHGTIEAITALAGMTADKRAAMGKRGQELIRNELSKQALCTRLGDLVEAALEGQPRLYAPTVGPAPPQTERTPPSAADDARRKAA